ncbi:hypothetical protein XELAEV_18023363mg [Xenopus laevis]|uniref:Uncharacterized protein n=1 Tax=Xenopus laevis TaxID=8355 RepID=A0A974D450_XENLA|nr:hypothetical protein XELAEV_18023363mg [Xenopus laevis]
MYSVTPQLDFITSTRMCKFSNPNNIRTLCTANTWIQTRGSQVKNVSSCLCFFFILEDVTILPIVFPLRYDITGGAVNSPIKLFVRCDNGGAKLPQCSY